MELKRTSKPLKPKNIYSKFSISRFLKEYNYPEFLIISQNEVKKIKAKYAKQAKKNLENFTQVKKY